MDHDGAGEDEAYGGRAFGQRRGLPFFRRNAHVVPEVHIALFHIDQVAEFGEVPVQVVVGECGGVAAVEVEDEFETVGRHILSVQFFDVVHFIPVISRLTDEESVVLHKFR